MLTGEPGPVANKDAIAQQIEAIRVRGTTNLSGGWLEGCMHVRVNRNDDFLNRVILMSDGLANRGITDVAQLVALAQQRRGEGVSTTTMGLGNDFNEDLLMEMANAGGGAFYFIESPEVAPDIFKEELRGLLRIVGQNLMISVRPGQHVTHVRQLNAYQTQDEGPFTTFRLGDVFGSEVKTLLLELRIPALSEIGETQVATLRFSYDEILADRTEHREKQVAVMVNVQPANQPKPLRDHVVAEQVLLLKAANARRQAVHDADRGRYREASDHLRTVAQAIAEADIENPTLDEERESLLRQASDIERGGSSYNQYSRKTMATQAFYTMTDRHSDTVMLRLREIQRESGALPADDAAPQPVERVAGEPPTHVRIGQRTIPLDRDLLRLGRAAQNEIVISEKGVSRFHGQLTRQNGQIILEDLGSTNGTLIDGQRVLEPRALSVGDIVFLCNTPLVFIRQESAPYADAALDAQQTVTEHDAAPAAFLSTDLLPGVADTGSRATAPPDGPHQREDEDDPDSPLQE